MENWRTYFKSKLKTLVLFSVLTPLSLFSQDISVKNIVFNNGTTFCEADSDALDIVITLESDASIDLENETITIQLIGANSLGPSSSTLTGAKFDLTVAGTVSFSLFSVIDLSSPLSTNNFSAPGSSTLKVSIGIASDTNSINNSRSVPFSVIEFFTPVIKSNTAPDFSICEDEGITLYADAKADTTYYWRFDGDDLTTPLTQGNSVAKAVGELSNGETIYLYAVTGTCTSSVASQTITVTPKIDFELKALNLPDNTVCAGEDITLYVDSPPGVASYTWNIGDNTYRSDTPTRTFSSDLIQETGSSISVIVTPQGSDCGTEKFISLEKFEISSPGAISSPNSIICSSQIPDPIASTAAATKSPAGVTLTYRWEYTTQADGDFTLPTTVGVASNSLAYGFTEPLTTTTWFRRVAVGTYNNVVCEEATLPVKIEVENIEGGTISPSVLYTCSLDSNEIPLEVTENNYAAGGFTYQWQQSNSVNPDSFTNITTDGTSADYTVSIATSQTTYFRRITTSAQLSDTTCGIVTSTLFSLIVNDIDPGTLTAYDTGIYCYGSFTPKLGENSPVISPNSLTYQWYQVTASSGADTDAPAEEDWVPISGATNQTFQPPPLIEDISYRRGVTVNDGSGVLCETYTEPLRFKVYDPLEVGYIVEKESQETSVTYCENEVHPILALSGLSGSLKNAMERTGSNPSRNPTVSWEISTNKTDWSPISDNEPNGNWTTLNRNFGTSTEILLTQTLYYRTKFVFQDVDNDNTTAVTTQTTTAESIILLPTGGDEANITAGETFLVTVGSTSVSVTTQVGSTTDQIGEALAAKLDQVSDFAADYYSESNALVLNNLNNKTVLVDGIQNADSDPISLDLYYLQQQNSVQSCTVYSEVFTLEVTPAPELTLNSGAEYQIICEGSTLDEPLTVQWSNVETVTFTSIPAGLSITNQTTNSITINGTPATSGFITFTAVPNCDGKNELLTLTWEVTSAPPPIFDIFKDFDDPGYTIRNGDGTGADGYNNSICIDTESTNNTKFYACFIEDQVNYSNLEWEFISDTYTLSPTIFNPIVQRAPVGSSTREDNAEIGIQVTWASDFIDNISLPGEWVTVKVRSVSKCDASIKSDWASKKVWLVKYGSSGTNSQTIPDLPELTIPIAEDPNQNCELAGKTRIGIPTCEPIKADHYTQFYAQASGTTNDFSHIEWEIDHDPGNNSIAKVGTIDAIGRLFYTPGFYGAFTVRARPVSCVGSTTFGEWVESAVYEVGQNEKTIPKITPYGLPVCPIPDSGVVTTTLTSDRDVYWFVKNLDHIESSSVTQTGETFYQYQQLEGDAEDPLKQITFQWNPGTDNKKIFFKAVPVGCSGIPVSGLTESGDRYVRNYVVEAPEGPELRPDTDYNFSVNPKICNDQTNFTPLVYEIIGYTSVIDVTVEQPSGQVSPSVINKLTETNQKIMTMSWNNGTSPGDIPYDYIITINDVDFKYNGLINQPYDDIMEQLRQLIDASNSYTAIVSDTRLIQITGEAGVPFNMVSNIPEDSRLILNFETINSGYSQFKILGLDQAIETPGIYEFNFGLDVLEGCVDETDVKLTLEVNSDVEIDLVEVNTNSPLVCYNENFEDILYSITGLDSGVDAYVTGNLPSNVSFEFENNGAGNTSTVTITSSGVTNYWNTRTFDYELVTEGDFCDDGFNSGGKITVYPQDFIRPEGHYEGGENEGAYVQQTICEGEAIEPIVYEYWGVDTIQAILNDSNTLGLETSISSRTQKAMVAFEDGQGVLSIDNQTYSIIINDTYSTVSALKSATATSVISSLKTKLDSDSGSLITTVASGTALYITAKVSGTTFALETSKSDNAQFNFQQPKMLEAPHLITITGTPTFDDVFSDALSATSTVTFNIETLGGVYCNGIAKSKTQTFTLTVNPEPRIEIFQGSNTTICYGYSSDDNTLGFNLKGGISNIEIGFVDQAGNIDDFSKYFNAVDPTSSTFEYNFEELTSSLSNLTTTTIFTITVTATSNFGCGTPASLTDTLTIVPHYITHKAISGNLQQTHCLGSTIDPIEFEYSALDATYSIIWGTSGNPGNLGLTSSEMTLTLSGTIDASLTITQTTEYTFEITIEGNEDNCIPLTRTGTITVSPGPKLDLKTASTTIEQGLCYGETPQNITYEYSGAATAVVDPVWKKNGVSNGKPPWVSYNREVPGQFTLQATSITEKVDVVTVYEYELTTKNSSIGTSQCIEDTQKGYYILYPDAQFFNDQELLDTSIITEIEVCEGDYFEKKIYFKSAQSLSVSPVISPIGLSKTVSITTKQSYTLSVSGTAALDDFATIEILKATPSSEDLVVERFRYTAPSNNTTSATIAAGLKNKIDTTLPSQFDVDGDNHLLTITSASNDKIFGVRFITSESIELSVVSATALSGYMTLTGTPTTDLVTEATTYSIDLETTGSSCSTDSLTLEVTLLPYEELSSSGGLLNQSLCYGSTLDPITISGATNYNISWSPNAPSGITPVGGELVTSTIQIRGTHINSTAATTSYTYTISIVDSSDRCVSNETISGTLTFYPKEEWLRSGPDSQTVCTGDAITPVVYDLSNGYNNSNITTSWSTLPAPSNLDFVYSAIDKNLTLSGTVPTGLTTSTTYTYTVTFTSEFSCTSTSTTGQIVVEPKPILSLTSSLSTINQIICEGTAIEEIIYSYGLGATSVNPTGLPTGLVIVDTPGEQISITGTPTIDVTVPTTYAFSFTTEGSDCDAIVKTGYLTLLPKAEVYFNDAVNPELRSKEVSICNGSEIEDIRISFTNTPGIEISNSVLPAGTDNLSFSESITKRQETKVSVSGNASLTAEKYSIFVTPVGGAERAFIYETTVVSETAEDIAQGLLDAIEAETTSVSATLDGNVLTIFNTNSSTLFTVKTKVEGEATLSEVTTQAVQGDYVISGTVSLSSSITSFTLNFESLDPSNGTLCEVEQLSVKFNLYDAPSINVSEDTEKYNFEICDGITNTLHFEYAGENTSILSENIVWSPSNPGFDLLKQAGTNSFTLSGEISTNVTQTTTYNYSITTAGSTCQEITYTGSIKLIPSQLITHIDESLNEYAGGNTVAEGSETQIICDGNAIEPIVYHLEGGTVSHTITWTPSLPGGLNYQKAALGTGGYALTLSGTINTNISTQTVYNYEIETTGENCSTASRVGAITVRPKPKLSLVTTGTNIQVGINAVCNLSNSQPVTYQYDGSTVSTELNWIGDTGQMPGTVESDYDENTNQITYFFKPSTTSSVTVIYEYSLTSVSEFGCSPQKVLFGSIEVLPSVTIFEDNIRLNHITHVTCPDGNDGSIIIPSDKDGFNNAIFGGQNAIAQIVSVTLQASNTLEKDDIVRLVIDGTTYAAIVPTDTSSQSILQALADEINLGSAKVYTEVTASSLLLTASTPGIPFNASGVAISSSVTGTTVVSTVVSNVSLDFDFIWRRNSQIVGNSMRLVNQPAGIYELTVSINGCATSSATFEIKEPSISYSENTIDISCDGKLSIPLTVGLTPTQVEGTGNLFSAKLFRIVNNVFTEVSSTTEIIEQRFSPVSVSNTIILDFDGYLLQPGEIYKVVVQNESCSEILLEIPIGPITDKIIIQEDLIKATDIVCWGENDGTLTVPNNAVIGGSGSYSYKWISSTGVEYFFKNLYNLPPGSYRLTVTDNENDCETTSDFFEIEDTVPVNISDLSSDKINQCVDGTNGFIQILAPQGFGVRWEFVPSVTSQTFELTGVENEFQFNAVDAIPNGYSTTGVYTYYLYEGGLTSSCAVDGGQVIITGPSPVSLSSSLTFSNIVCAGEENGTIQFTATGGIAPYTFSIKGGTPTEPFSNGNTNYITNLGPGTYDIVIGDSTPDDCTPNTYTTQVVITEPTGGPLELSEGEIKAIPCFSGGSGSFEIKVTGGSTTKIVNEEEVENNTYQVFVEGLAGNYKLNTSLNSTEGSVVIQNIVSPGDYTVTVTDGSGNCSQEITVSIDIEANENLSATAQGVNSTDCNSLDSENSGGYIQVLEFLKGNGEVAGYPIWQRLTSRDVDSFIIALSGSVESFNPTQIGVVIGGAVSQTINLSSSQTVTYTTLTDVAAVLVDNINSLPNFSATLLGSTISVKSPIIDSVSEIASTSSTLNLSVSNISKVSESLWVDIEGAAGKEKIENLQAGTYRGLINDTSGCGASLVKNINGGTTFRIDSPQSLQFKDINIEEITCSSPTSSLEFKLSNGAFTIVPDANIFELNLNSTVLKSTIDTGVSFSTSAATATNTSNSSTVSPSSTVSSSLSLSGNYYTPNFNKNTITIENLIQGEYELTVRNKQTECSIVLNFTIEQPPVLIYEGETDFIIDSCFEKYEDIFFDQDLLKGGTPYLNANGEPYYSLVWKFYPQDAFRSIKTINSLSNNINFSPEPGRYELYIKDANGCTLLDDSGTEIPIEFTFYKELYNLIVKGTGGIQGDELSQPVSCEIDAEDGQINIEVVNADPESEVPPFDIRWELQAPNTISFEQRLLFEGSVAGDSLEVYSIRLNEIPFTYVTQTQNEPKESVVSEITQLIDQSSPFQAEINPDRSNEILIQTASQAALTLDVVSQNTRLQMIKSTSNIAAWIPLDGTNGNPNYNGFLDLDGLEEGLYRYTITSANQVVCDNNIQPNSLQGVITVENENILEIREGPLVDEYLCNGQPGTLFIDVFDGGTGPLTFFYNGAPVTFEQVGTDQYLINIDEPVETASLEIYNAINCGISREINIGNGTPLFDFTSINFEQTGGFLAREDITFSDLSENEYDSFEFYFGDGNQTERFERNSPEPIQHEYAISGTYYVTLRIYNDLGCMDELTKTIKIGKGYNILTPNVFTPNGDIWNNTFRPVFNGLSEITLRIYDPQGALIYEEVGAEGKDPEIQGISLRGWDGANNSIEAPYYIYTLTAKTIDEQEVFRDGTFIILR